jgi:5-aminolevulinate synthase
MLPSSSHIVPVLIGDAVLCRRVSERLMKQHHIYVQPINFPSVKKGEERLRLTPSADHTTQEIVDLVYAIEEALQYCVQQRNLGS